MFKSTSWNPYDLAVLCFIRVDGKILLIHKLRGLGIGKINGPGGKCEPGELPEQTAIRETQEEVGLTPLSLKESGTLRFHFADGYQLEGRVFLAESYSGTPVKTEEADPFWCDETHIPYDKMWEDDILWLPLVLSGSYVEANFCFDGDRMVFSDVTEFGPSHSGELRQSAPQISKKLTTLSDAEKLLLRMKTHYANLINPIPMDKTGDLAVLTADAAYYGFHDFHESLNTYNEQGSALLDLQFLRIVSVLKEQIYLHTVL